MLEVFQIPDLTDNYIHIIRNPEGQLKNQIAVIDPCTAPPVNKFLEEKNWSLNYILNTHHHYDHVGGNKKLKNKWNCSVVGFMGDQKRIPEISVPLKENDVWFWDEIKCQILFIPGHTSGHIAFWFEEDKLLFCGDTLFSMGCGRLFEGTPEQMFKSLKKIASLPPDTLVYCGHEYTLNNSLFALSIESGNLDLQKRHLKIKEKRKTHLSTVPFKLEEELQTNPFLRTQILFEHPEKITHPEIKNTQISSELELFTLIRSLKDQF